MGDLIIEQNITLDVMRQQMAAEGRSCWDVRPSRTCGASGRSRPTTPPGITAHLNQVDKYVFSSTLTDPGWENTTVLSGELSEEIARVKAATHGAIGVTGSISLCHQLIAAGLVDLYRLYVFPRVTGRGRTLFPAGTDVALSLENCHAFRSQIMLATYRPH